MTAPSHAPSRSLRRPALAAFLAAALACPLVAASAYAADAAPTSGAEAPKRIKGQYIVTFDRSTPDSEVGAAREGSRDRGAKVRYTYRHAVKGFTASMSDEEAARLRKNPRVLAVEPDYEVHTTGTTQSPAIWGLDRVDQRNLPLSGGYTYSTNGAGVTAYIIDTGIRTTHTQFGGRASSGFTAINDGRGTTDCNGHGTHVAGTVGGSTYGVAKGVNLVAVRVLDCNGSGSNSGVIAGIDWVTAHHTGPSVANMSLGGGASTALDNAVANSIASGVTYAVAAGNDNTNACLASPARAATALTVGATTSSDARASFSNYGTCLDIFAPGQGITSSVNTSDTATASYSGTSMAAPHVAGVVATYLQAVPAATPAEVRTALLDGSTSDVVSGAGTGSPNQLLYSALTTGTPPPPPPPPPLPPPPPPSNTAPVAVAPAVAIASPGQLSSTSSSSSVPLRVSWSAADADGISSYRLQRSTNGGSWSTISLPSSGATSVTLNQSQTSSVRFRVRATDNNGLTGDYATGATFALTLAQQNNSAASYPAGTWNVLSSSSASGGSLRQSGTTDARVVYSFTGSQVAWIGTYSPSRGMAEVFVDGVSQGVVDTYGSSSWRRVMYAGSFANGPHTLEIRVLGSKNPASSNVAVDADAFVTVR